MDPTATDEELQMRLRRLGSRIDEIRSAKRAAAPRDHVEKLPLGPDDPEQIAILNRYGVSAFVGPGSQLAGLASLVAFLKALRRTSPAPLPPSREGGLAHGARIDKG